MANKIQQCAKGLCEEKCNPQYQKTRPVKAWYLKDTIVNRYEENKTDPPEYLTDEEIYLETEVVMSWVDLGDSNDPAEFERRARAVRNMPLCMYAECDTEKEKDEKAIDEKADKFYRHHFHVGEVMRVITDGSGYLDIMDLNGRWIRRPLSKGDAYIIPSGNYHRVTLDMNKRLNALLMHYDKASEAHLFWPDSQTDAAHVQYIERMKCLRRSLNLPYRSRPGSVDCDKALNRP